MKISDISHCFVGVNAVISIIVMFVTIVILIFIGSSLTISTGFTGNRINSAKLLQTIHRLRNEGKLNYRNIRKEFDIDNVTYIDIINMQAITEEGLDEILKNDKGQ